MNPSIHAHLQFPRYCVQPIGGWHPPFYVRATNAKAAWAKCCTQRFGALKPNRRDYTVRKEPV